MHIMVYVQQYRTTQMRGSLQFWWKVAHRHVLVVISFNLSFVPFWDNISLEMHLHCKLPVDSIKLALTEIDFLDSPDLRAGEQSSGWYVWSRFSDFVMVSWIAYVLHDKWAMVVYNTTNVLCWLCWRNKVKHFNLSNQFFTRNLSRPLEDKEKSRVIWPSGRPRLPSQSYWQFSCNLLDSPWK